MGNISQRLERLENRQKEKNLSVEIILYKENEEMKEVLKQREAELIKKIDNPIFIKIISNN